MILKYLTSFFSFSTFLFISFMNDKHRSLSDDYLNYNINRDSLVYIVDTIEADAYIYTYVDKESIDYGPKTIRSVILNNKDTFSVKDFSKYVPDAYLLVTREEFRHLLSLKSKKQNLALNSIKTVGEKLTIINTSKGKKGTTYKFSCKTEFIRFFIDVNLYKSFFWVTKKMNFPSNGYLKILVPLSDKGLLQ